MASSKYVPNKNVIPDKRKKKEEETKTGYRYDKTGKKINSSDKDNGSKKSNSSNKKGETEKVSPSYRYDSKGRKIESSSANNKQSNPYQIGNNGPVAVSNTKANTPNLYGFQTRTASPDAQSRMLEYAYRQAYGYDQNTLTSLGIPDENVYKNVLAFQINQAANSSNPNNQAFVKYYSDLLKAAELNDSALANKDKQIESLKAQGQNDNWWNKMWGTHRYTNQDEIDAAEKEREQIVSLLKTSSMDDITGKTSAGTNLANYSKDDYLNDLMYLVNVYTLGHESDPQELQTTTQRIRDFVGGAAEDVETVAKNDMTGGNWVSDYLDIYDKRVDTLNRYISRNSNATGKEYEFGADEYISYLRSLNQLEQNAADAEQRQVERDQQIEEKYGSLKDAEDFDMYSQHMPREGGYYDEYGVLDWKAQVNDMVALGVDKEKFEDAPYYIGLDPAVDTDAYEYLEYGLQYMTDENRKMFYYLYNHPDHGPDEAMEYLDDISYDTMRQNMGEYKQSIETALDNGDWKTYAAASAAAPVFGFLNSISGMDTAFGKLTGENYHEWHPNFKYGTFRDTITGGVGNKIAEATPGMFKIAGQNAWQMGYNAVMSSAESMMSVGAFGKAGSVAMGFGAFNSTYQQGLADGKSDTDAFIDALVEGGIEVGTEAIGIDALLGDNSNPLGYFLKNMIAEGGEEGLGSAARMGYDQWKYGVESKINTRRAELEAQGMNPTDAAKTAWGEWLREFAQDTVTGTISGAVMSGPTAAASGFQNVQKGGEIQQAIDEAVEAGDLEDLKTFIEVSKGLPDQPRYIQRIIERVESQIAEEEAKPSEKPKASDINPAERLDQMKPNEKAKTSDVNPAERLDQMKPSEKPKTSDINPAERLDQMKPNKKAETSDVNPAERLDQMKPSEKPKASDVNPAERLDQMKPSEKADTEVKEQADDLAEEMQENPENADEVAEKITKPKKNKITKGQLGQLYRYVMTQLQEDAQNTLRESMSYNVAKELKRGGIKGEEAKTLATSILRMQDGSFTQEDIDAINGNSTARSVLMNWVKKDADATAASAKASRFANLLQPRDITANEEDDYAAEDEPAAANEFDAKAAEVEQMDADKMESDGEISTYNGEPVKIVGIDSEAIADKADSKLVRIINADGTEQVVEADEIAYGSNDSSAYALVQYAADYGRNADIMYNAYMPGQDVTAYAAAFNAAAQHGSDGRNIASLMKTAVAETLTEDQIRKAYEIGRNMRVQRSKESQTARSQKGAGVKTGRVDTSAIKNTVLKSHQKATIKAMESLAEVLDMNVRFVASKADAKGRYTTENGSWDANSRTLTVDIHAGSNMRNDVRYAMMDTVGHELTHYIRQFADSALWDEYQDFVISHLENKMNLEREIQKKMAMDDSLSRDDAIEEIIADASAQALSRITDQQIAELAESNPNLFKKIANFIKRWVNNLRKRIDKAYATSEAKTNRFAKAMQDSLDEMGGKWNALLANANRNAQATAERIGSNMVVTENGAVVSPEVAEIMNSDEYAEPDNGLFSLRETNAWAESHRSQYPNDTNFADNLALIQHFDRDVAADSVLRYLVPHGRIQKSKYGPLRNNVEYVYTFDMDTKCERTYQFLAYRDAVQKRIGRQLTENEARSLIELMRAYGQMIPCTYCYVEGKRMKLAELYMKYLKKNGESVMGTAYSAEQVFDIVESARTIVSGYLDNKFNVSDNYQLDDTLAGEGFEGYKDFMMPISEDAAAAEIFERYNITDKAAKRVVQGFVAEWVYNRRMDLPLNLVNADADFRTDSIDEKVLSFHDLATKAAQGGAKAKGIENYEPYIDQVKNISEEDKRYMVGMGGIRKHSSNDFQIQNVQDYMLFFMDLAADKRGGVDWTGHTYTKNLDYARIFAPTNDRINVSIAMYGDDVTGIRPNTQEGVNWEELQEIRKQYKNVGAMAMVVNNDQLSFGLNSDWIDMIIPFHASGMKRSLYYDVLAWTDYTSKQSERLYNKGQMIAKLRERGIKVNSSAKAADVQRMFMETFNPKVVINEKTGKRIAPHFFPGETVQHGVVIPGHNNDAQRYFELCEEYATNPRFFGVKVKDASGNTIDVTQHPNYLKLIKETARTDSEQEAIVAKFDMDYANKAMKGFRGYSNLSEDTYGIVDEFIREYIGKNRKVGYLTERAKETREIMQEMADAEQQKRTEKRAEMLKNIEEADVKRSARNASEADDISYSLREGAPPKTSATAYKLFNVDENGMPHALFIDAANALELGAWYNADSPLIKDLENLEANATYYVDKDGNAEIRQYNNKAQSPSKKDLETAAREGGRFIYVGVYKDARRKGQKSYANWGLNGSGQISTFAMRPGWHMTDVPAARHIGEGRNGGEALYRRPNQRWFKVEYATDVDYNGEAAQNPTKDIATHIPTDGWYSFRTNTNAEADQNWIISGALKIVAPVSEKEAHRIAREAGVPEDLPYRDGIKNFTEDDVQDDISYQMRDPYTASDREMLVSAFDNASLSVEDRNRLNGYKKKIGELDKKQRLLEQTTDRINMLEASDAEKNREEIIKLQNTAQIYAQQIERADAELLKIEALAPIRKLAEKQRATYIREVKAGYDERLQKYKQKQDEKTRERIQKIKDREAEKRKDMRKEMDRLKKVAEPNLKEKYRNKILSDVKKLYSWVATPTNKGHVPNFLKAPLGEFLQTIDYSSINYLKSAKPGIKDISMAEALENLRRALANVHNQKSIEEGAQEQFDYMDLPAQYLEQLDVFVGDVKKAIQNAADVTKTPLMLLNSEQLEYLSEAIAILKHSVEKMNENFNKNQFESPRSAANASINDMYKLKAKTKTNKALEAVNGMYNWKNATPFYAFKRMGVGGQAVFEGMQDGWDKLAHNSALLIEYAEKAFTAKQAKAWSGDVRTITLANGEKVQITVSQLMSLYCLNKRTQAVGHLLGGGMRVGEIDLSRGRTLNQAENYTLTEADIGKMINMLTAEQKAVADKLQNFMNTTCTDWGNEISMKRFGYKMFTEQFYFPIEVDTNNLQRGEDKLEQKNSMFRLLNLSAMKPLTEKANNALVVRDIFDVFTEHSTDIAKYNALALPILDMIRWYQYTEKSDVYGEDGMPTGQNKVRSTRKALEHAYGKNATGYVRKFMADLNAEHDGGRNDGALQKLMGNAKAASVGWNARVYLLQITSLPRAAYAINPKYLLKGLAKWKSLNPVNAIKGTEAQDKIGILKWKSLGFYNTDIARSTRGMVRRDDGFLAKVRDYGMRPAGWGDNWTSNIIYEAAKAEMKDKHPSVKEGTEAYDKLLNKRVREIVYKTQVVDSTMTRSDLMRGKGIMQLFTAFMSEPTLSLNMLNESITEAVTNRRMGMTGKENMKSVGGKVMRAAAVFVFSATFSAIVEALFDAVRDDDEYETFWEKFMQGLFGEKMEDADGAWGKFKAFFDGNIGDNVNIFGMLPIIKELVSFLQGYEENSMVTQVAKQFTDLTKSIDSWKQGKRPLYDVIYKGFKVIGSATGIGVQNVSRDAVGTYNTFLADAWNTPKIQTYENTKAEAAEAFYEAVLDGDTEKAAWIVERAAINGYSEDDFESKISSLIKDDFYNGEIDEATAKKYLRTYGGKDTDKANEQVSKWSYEKKTGSSYEDMRDDYVSGSITATQAKQYMKTYGGVTEAKAAEQIDRWDYYKATGSSDGYTKYWRMYDAFENGGNFQKYAKQWIDAGVDKGTIAQSIAGRYKAEYLAIKGTAAGDRMLERLLDLYEAIGYDRNYERNYINKKWKL